jgi:hypothetical protein
MSGTLAIPNVLAALAGPSTQNLSVIDADFTAIRDYINNREITVGLLAARPAAGTAGRYYFATDQNGGTLYLDDGASWRPLASPVTGALAEQFTGLGISNNAGDATNDLDIAVGACTSDDAAIANRVLMSLTAALTKRLDAAWAVGTNQGGLDTGAIANTTYHVFLIQRNDTGVVDALFSTSATAPTMPPNYTKKRRIGSIVRAGATILAFFQNGDEVLWLSPVLDVNLTGAASWPNTAVLRVLTVPLGIRVLARMNVLLRTNTVGVDNVVFSSPDTTDLAPSDTASPLANVRGDATIRDVSQVSVWTDASGQIRTRAALAATGANDEFRVATTGFVDALRRR